MIYFIILIITVLGVWGFVHLQREFGSSNITMNVERVKKSKAYAEGRFFNIEPMPISAGWETTKKFFTEKNLRPAVELPVIKLPDGYFDTPPVATRVTWFGHSAIMLELDGQKIMIDPMLSDMPSPVPLGKLKRFSKDLPMSIEDLPKLDAILISHDHYDHLDRKSIQKLRHKVGHFFVPLGVGSHLTAWGVPEEDITELDWWQETTFKGIQLAFTPTRHFSGRGLGDKNSKLWGSWVIRGAKENIFFSGDSGYTKYFKEIGEKYGPFDFTMIECGQYNEAWASVHMMPEESIQAHIDLKGKLMMPIHWGAFVISIHDWREPVERALKVADRQKVELATPRIGESITFGKSVPKSTWWREL